MGTNIRNVQDIFSVMWSSQRNHRRMDMGRNFRHEGERGQWLKQMFHIMHCLPLNCVHSNLIYKLFDSLILASLPLRRLTFHHLVFYLLLCEMTKYQRNRMDFLSFIHF